MAYGQDLENAAQRHLDAADLLNRPHPGGRVSVAGYLYGLAAECALKRIMLASGMQNDRNSSRHDDPFFLHFPLLKTLLRDMAKGRHQGLLVKYAADSKLFNGWDITMRYANAKEINDEIVQIWAEQAKRLLSDMREHA